MIRKFIELKDLKSSDRGPGTIEGYRSVFSVDQGGDLIVKGAFADTIEDYLNSGFTAHSHQWSFSEAVGFPVEAYEDETGFWVKSQFHSTPDAQAVRTKAQERMRAGKKVGFSFGFSPIKFDYIDAKDYERELPKHIKAADLSYNMAQAKRFPKIRLIKKLEIFEDSLVTAPMNRQAAATGIKSNHLQRFLNPQYARLLVVRSKAVLALCDEPDDPDLRLLASLARRRAVAALRKN